MTPGRHEAGGSSFNTFVGFGLMSGLVIFGWIVLGTMLLLNEIFGGAAIRGDRPADEPAAGPDPGPPAAASAEARVV